MTNTSYYDTDAVRSCVAYVPVTSIDMRWSEEEAAEFDRWLATHDTEVKADAWDEGYRRGTLDTTSDLEPADNPWRRTDDREGA